MHYTANERALEPRARRGSKKWYLGNREGLLALSSPHAAAASALRTGPMKAVFVAVAAAAIPFRQWVVN